MPTLYLKAPSQIHGRELLFAFVTNSANTKTGNMVQVYILHPTEHPILAAQLGTDSEVCGTCPQRHHLGGGCYVNLGHGPSAVFKGQRPDRFGDIFDVLALVSGRKVRFGAYGDPAHIPADWVDAICESAQSWTAYTHQWRRPEAQHWRGRAMASLDSAAQADTARRKGWAYFVATSAPPFGATECVNQTHGTQCADCMACDGRGDNVWIAPHGARAARF